MAKEDPRDVHPSLYITEDPTELGYLERLGGNLADFNTGIDYEDDGLGDDI